MRGSSTSSATRYDGDRLAALDELEAQVALTFEGEPTWPVLRNVQPTVREFGLPREPFLRLIEANRIDQRVDGVRDAGTTSSTTACTPPTRAAGSCSACCGGSTTPSSSRRATRCAPACSSSTSCRTCRATSSSGAIYLPARGPRRFGDPALDRPSDELRALLRFEAERAAALLRAGDVLRARIGGRLGRAVGLFARGGLAALEALEEANWDIFTQRPKPSRARLAREAALVLVR